MRPHRKRGKGLSPVALAWIPFLAGCDRPADVESPEEPPFVERDSAGVLVATTSGAKARAPIGWVVDTVPDYQVGEMDGEDPYLFSRIEGARQLADGRVAVLDWGSCELRFFGSDGVFMNRTGGRGEGPGEFRRSCLPGALARRGFALRLRWRPAELLRRTGPLRPPGAGVVARRTPIARAARPRCRAAEGADWCSAIHRSARGIAPRPVHRRLRAAGARRPAAGLGGILPGETGLLRTRFAIHPSI